MSTESETSTTARVRTLITQLRGEERRLTVFSFGMYLDEDLFCAHNLDNLSYVRSWLLQKTKLFPQQPNPRVVVVALRLESSENGLSLKNLELHRLDLVVVVVVERHACSGPSEEGSFSSG
jgi:hypothetical protein